MNLFVVLRVVLGGVFVVSGADKIIGGYQNFLYVVQGYDLFGTFLEGIIAHVVPWFEFPLGVFLVLGFWMKWASRLAAALIAMFILVVGQAFARGLPIDECGCFGALISIPLYGMLMVDSVLFGISVLVAREAKRAGSFGLDRLFGA